MKKISYLFITIRLAFLDSKIKLSKKKIVKYRKKIANLCEKYHIPYFSDDMADEFAKSMSSLLASLRDQFSRFKEREN